MEESASFAGKPDDWPQNQREASIENVSAAFYEYKAMPTYENKEILLALITINEVNESDVRGVARITDHEVAKINELYLSAACMNLNSLRVYLYRHIMHMVLTMRMLPVVHPESFDNLFKPLEGLFPPMRLFFESYFDFRNEKTRSFADTIIRIVNAVVSSMDQKEALRQIEQYCVQMFYDLSFISSKEVFSVITFDRTELKKLFELLASIFRKTDSSITERPLLGTICILMSNWILKSRNDYNDDYLTKYMSSNAVKSVLVNNEIWMQKTEFLNDQREGKLIRELYANKQWIKFDWARKVELEKPVTTFVSSFSKNALTPKMEKEYGDNYFGFKNDRIGSLISPVRKWGPMECFWENVNCYDVIYGADEAKEELNYLFEIIDLFPVSDDQKNTFVNQIMIYWIYSFKDKKWESEKERRYEIPLFIEDNEYYDISIDERFLKLKSTLFLYPDFVSVNNIEKEAIKRNRVEKLMAIGTKSMSFCNECLNSEVQVSGEANLSCSICGSKNVEALIRDA